MLVEKPSYCPFIAIGSLRKSPIITVELIEKECMNLLDEFDLYFLGFTLHSAKEKNRYPLKFNYVRLFCPDIFYICYQTNSYNRICGQSAF